MDRFLDMDVAGLIARVKPVTEKHMRLTDAIGSLLQDFNMVCPPLPPEKPARFSTLCHLDVPPNRRIWRSVRCMATCCSTPLAAEFAHPHFTRIALFTHQVSYVPLDASDPDSVALVLSQIDHAIQYGEDVEPSEPENLDVD
jgi:hypothetical protein